MEINAIVADLKQKIEENTKAIPALEEAVAHFSKCLAEAKAELTERTDQLTAFRMAIESLEMLTPKKEEKPVPHVPTVMEPSKPHAHVHSRTPREIVRTNASGEHTYTYKSINQCAKVMGWTNTALRKYIETTSPEKQIRLRGFVLKFSGEK